MQTIGKFLAGQKSFVRAVFVLIATLSFVAVAGANDARNIREGKELAMTVCSPCHVITSQPSQHPAPSPPGPSFEEIAKGSKAAPEALHIFLLSTQSNVGHPGSMPNLKLTEDQIRLISAYLSSLRNTK